LIKKGKKNNNKNQQMLTYMTAKKREEKPALVCWNEERVREKKQGQLYARTLNSFYASSLSHAQSEAKERRKKTGLLYRELTKCERKMIFL
jgi:hypothetical protein